MESKVGVQGTQGMMMDDDLSSNAVPQDLYHGDSYHPGLMAIVWAYPILSLLLMGINLYFIVHALRNGRPYYWIWILFGMPLVGAIAYYLVEMRPNLHRIDWKQIRWRFSSPQSRIQTLQGFVAHSPTVKNRSLLANEYEAQGRWRDAEQQYRESLNGVFADDPRLRLLLASTLLEQGNGTEAHQIVRQILEQRDSKLEDERKLMLARCQSAIGEYELAIQGFTQLCSKTYSLAPRFFLAETKSRQGKHQEAELDAQNMIKAYRQGNPLFRKSEQPWYRRAKALLLKKPAA